MARSDSNTTLKYVAGSVAVIAAAFCIGYFFIGGSRPQPTAPENLIPSNPPVAATPAPVKQAVLVRSPRTQNGEYTAPGSPSIRIAEDKTPSLVDLSKVQNKAGADATKSNDPEASQEAAPTPKKSLHDATDADTNPTPDSNATTSGDTPPTPPDGDSTSPSATAPTTPPAPPTDPDSEQVGGHPDSEAGQDGTGGKAQFRVQAGSFVAPENAKALADALHRRGYDTSTHAERDGDKTVYKVQVGAYRSRTAANKAAQDLQSSGYPASVAPISGQ